MKNDNKINNREYNFIVDDILNNNEFNKLDEITHHGLTRKSHSIRVSYYSYKLCKILNLDYKSAARAGLLHDFFLNNNHNCNIKDRIVTLVNHPKYALDNAKENFELNVIEEDIIVSHMFPVSLRPSKYLESWIVNFVDDVVAIAEVTYTARNKASYAANFLLLLMFTYLR